MKVKFFLFNYFSFVRLVLIIAFFLISFIPVRIAVAFHQAPIPQAIFVLGGAALRMEFAGEFWQRHTDLDIWVSDYAWNFDIDRRIFHQLGVPNQQLRLDGRATDTVTNFTSLVEDFVAQNLQHIYLITSDYHMRRARAIAAIILGSRGVVVTPVAVLSRGEESYHVRLISYDSHLDCTPPLNPLPASGEGT
jgi:uncharacterized SAM-binding protein YcdF (DUF218 family)